MGLSLLGEETGKAGWRHIGKGEAGSEKYIRNFLKYVKHEKEKNGP